MERRFAKGKYMQRKPQGRKNWSRKATMNDEIYVQRPQRRMKYLQTNNYEATVYAKEKSCNEGTISAKKR